MSKKWLQVRAQLGKVLRIRQEDAHGFIGTTENGRDVHVQRVGGDQVEWLLLRTPLCRQGELSPGAALERNASLAFTVLLLERGLYWLRMSVPLDSGEVGDPASLVSLLNGAADSLRPHFQVGATDGPLFRGYVD